MVHSPSTLAATSLWERMSTSDLYAVSNREWWNTKFLGLPLIPLKRCGPCLVRGQWRRSTLPLLRRPDLEQGSGFAKSWPFNKSLAPRRNVNEQRWQGRGFSVTVLRSVSNGNFFFLSHFICSRKIFLSKHLGSIGNFTPIIRTIRVCVWWLCYH